MSSKDHGKKYKLTGRSICPFHRYSTDIKIACEGYDPESVSVKKWYGENRDRKKEEWQKKYCEKRGTGCPYHDSLEKLYNTKQ